MDVKLVHFVQGSSQTLTDRARPRYRVNTYRSASGSSSLIRQRLGLRGGHACSERHFREASLPMAIGLEGAVSLSFIGISIDIFGGGPCFPISRIASTRVRRALVPNWASLWLY